MNSRFYQAAVFFFLTFILTAVAGEPKMVSLAELPPAVQKTIKGQVGGNKLGDIERDEEAGNITYDVQMTQNGEERTFTVDDLGVLTGIEVGLDETPALVRKTIQVQVGQGELDSIEKTFDNGDVSYEVEMTTKTGAERSFTVAAHGKLERLQVTLDEAPAAVRKTIGTHTVGGKLGDLFRVFDDDGVSYEMNFSAEGRERDLSVAENGKLESKQVFLSELLPAAQKTIKEKIGDGKILRIDHVFEQKMGVLPYEVEGRKDGKPFNFSVGPKGRFLGMDE
jgi:uncharacterized membrane protein YkoI